jgi:hypothetical protein
VTEYRLPEQRPERPSGFDSRTGLMNKPDTNNAGFEPSQDPYLAHICIDGKIKPYVSLVCSGCPADHGCEENHLTIEDLVRIANRCEVHFECAIGRHDWKIVRHNGRTVGSQCRRDLWRPCGICSRPGVGHS